MKFTTEQEEAMQKIKEEVTLLIKKYPSRSTRNLQFEILNMRDTRYPSLKCFRVSYGWIGKMKKATLKPSQRSIVKEVAEKQLLQWFKNRKRNPFSNLVTTKQVKAKWKLCFSKPPTEYALMSFKKKYNIKVIYDSRTRNTNSWTFN